MTNHLAALAIYDVVIGVFTAVGIGYLFYLQRTTVTFNRFLYFLLAAFLVFSVGGPMANLLLPSWVHAVHGAAALLAVFALYNPVTNDLRKDEWARIVLQDPRRMRNKPAWMTPMDDDVLELFHSTDLVLTPSVIADNLGYSRGEVNRHLSVLDEHGFLERVDRGKYRLTEVGEEYLRGEPVEGWESH